MPTTLRLLGELGISHESADWGELVSPVGRGALVAKIETMVQPKLDLKEAHRKNGMAWVTSIAFKIILLSQLRQFQQSSSIAGALHKKSAVPCNSQDSEID